MSTITSPPRPARFRHRIAAAIASLFLAGAGPQPAGATVPSDLCTGNPCNVTGTRTVDPGTTLDFGAATDLRLKGNALVKIGSGAGPLRWITLRARSIVLEPGAGILGDGDDADVELEATGGGISLQAAGNVLSRIDVRGASAGVVQMTASGDVVIAGPIDASGSGEDSAGGEIDIDAAGSVTSTADLLAGASGVGSTGGTVAIDAGTGVSLGGVVDVSSTSDAGSIEITSGFGPIAITRRLGASGGDPDGYGGSIGLDASFGDVQISGPIVANGGSGIDEQCGDAGYVTINAGLAISVGADVTLRGGTQCTGGSFEASAGTSVTQAAATNFSMGAAGLYGSGGDLSVDAFGDVTLRDADLVAPGWGGLLDARSAGGHVQLLRVIDARGTASDSVAGSARVEGCRVTVGSGARLDVRGAYTTEISGVTTLIARDALTVSGTLRAQAANRIRIRGGQPTLGGTILPDAAVTVDPTVPACAPTPLCGNGIVESGEYCDSTLGGASCCAADCRSTLADGAACTDGLYCNGTDSCAAGACTRHSGNPCATAAGSCATAECTESFHCSVAPQTACDDADGNPCTEGRCSDLGLCVPTANEATCDDGVWCNGSEVCIAGSCRRIQPDCPTGSCDEGAAACEAFCGDGVARAGETCGEPGTPICPEGQTCRNCACESGGIPGDSYVCYAAAPSTAFGWSFTPATKKVDDRLGRMTADLSAIDALCSPAVMTSRHGVFPPSSAGVAQMRLAIAPAATETPEPAFVPITQSVTDRFGTLELVLLKPVGLLLRARLADFGAKQDCVESDECPTDRTCQGGVCLPDPAAAPSKPPNVNAPVDNFECYSVKVRPGTPAFTPVRRIRVTDQFDETLLYDATKPSHLCGPANFSKQNPAAPGHPGHLTCYTAKPSAGTPKQAGVPARTVATRSKGLPPAFLDLAKGKEICVPSRLAAAP